MDAMADIPATKLRWADLWLLLAFPLYQTFGTIRHEGSHALAAKIKGADITEFVPYPQWDTGRFTWGYSNRDPRRVDGFFTDFAPYLCDLLWFAGFFLLLTRIRWTRYHWLWINLVIVGLISPGANSFANWIAGVFLSDDADVERLLDEGPDVLIHGHFLITVAAYALGCSW
jgi:Peptidase M50B-like